MAIVVLVYVSMKYPANRPTTPAKPPALIVSEADGHVERSTGWWNFSGHPRHDGQNIDWAVISRTDSDKPRFVFAMRSRTPKEPTWTGEEHLALKLVADEQPIILNGQRHEY